MNPLVTIVVPVYRNVDTLHELYRRVCQSFEGTGMPFELLFVEDACPDGSLAVLTQIAEADSRVAVLAMGRNVGQHRAVLAGLAWARGDWTVIMDADLQDPPEQAPALVAHGQQGFAAVFAGRRGRYQSSARMATSRVFKWVLHLLTGVPADAGIFCAINRQLRLRLLAMAGPQPSLVAMIGCAGLPMTSIPVARATRPTGHSAYSSWSRLITGWRAIVWVLNWKARALLERPQPPAAPPPIRACFGARFAPQAELHKDGNTT